MFFTCKLSPWYNHYGWPDVNHQFTYLLWKPILRKGPTIVSWKQQQQKHFFLWPIRRTESSWCSVWMWKTGAGRGRVQTVPVLYADAGDKSVPSLSISHKGTCGENLDDESADLKICSFVFAEKRRNLRKSEKEGSGSNLRPNSRFVFFYFLHTGSTTFSFFRWLWHYVCQVVNGRQSFSAVIQG